MGKKKIIKDLDKALKGKSDEFKRGYFAGNNDGSKYMMEVIKKVLMGNEKGGEV